MSTTLGIRPRRRGLAWTLALCTGVVAAAPPGSPTLDHERDLMRLYRAKSVSTLPFEVVQARFIVAECSGFLSSFDDWLGVVAAQGGGEEEGQQRRDAIHELVRRCDGFDRMSVESRRRESRRLEQRATELGAPEAKAWDDRPLTQTDIRSMLVSVSGANANAILPPLGDLHAVKALIAGFGTRARDVGGMAAFLALCELSGSCDVDAFRTLLGCAFGGRCGTALTDGWEETYSLAEQRWIAAQRDLIVDAVRRRDWTALERR